MPLGNMLDPDSKKRTVKRHFYKAEKFKYGLIIFKSTQEFVWYNNSAA